MRLQHKNHIRPCAQDYVFYSVNTLLMVLFTLIIAYPLLFVIFASFDGGAGTLSVNIWPSKWSDAGYRAVFEYGPVWIGYRNSLLYTVVGALFGLIFCVCAAYPLAQPNLDGRNLFMGLFVFTMYFGGGLIPTFLVVNALHLYNTRAVMVLLYAFSMYNCIICRTFFSSLPKEVEEAAIIDGCTSFQVFWQIVLPLSKALMGVMVLYFAVVHWNTYFAALIYLRDADKHPLQLVLRKILILETASDDMIGMEEAALAKLQLKELVKYAVIIVSSLPVLILYPFLQKYFDQGVMIGSVKG